MKKLILIILAGNFAILTTVFSLSPKHGMAIPELKWDATEYVCNLPGHSGQYTRGECFQEVGGRWISCTDWDCTSTCGATPIYGYEIN
jgi:hypothetical protein